ncbi:MAG: hypothetical protein V7K97_03930 [Nostoc sp.]
MTTKAKRALIQIAGIEIEAFQLPDESSTKYLLGGQYSLEG